MKKSIVCVILLFISLSLLLSGCIQIDVDFGIDDNYTAHLSYRISMDVSDMDLQYHDVLRNALHNIGWYYQENYNFAVEINFDTDPFVLTMTRQIENHSLEQAYKSLEYMLTDEDSTIFMEVDAAFQSNERQDRYVLGAMADIPKIMSLSNAEELAPVLQQQLKEALETGNGNITLTLPASEIISSTHQAQMRSNQAVMSVPLNYSGQTVFELIAVVNYLKDGSTGGSLGEIIQEQNRLRELSILICSAAFIILLILILVLILTIKKRKNEVAVT